MSSHREKCLEEKGEECHICGSGGEVQVHHINGDKSDNSLKNLIPVCHDCHSSIHDDTDRLKEWSNKILPPSERTRTVSMTVTPEEQDLIEVIREASGADSAQQAMFYAVKERVHRLENLSAQRRFLREIRERTDCDTDESAMQTALEYYTHFLTDFLDDIDDADFRPSVKQEIADAATSDLVSVNVDDASVGITPSN
jgi:hypothetical protein